MDKLFDLITVNCESDVVVLLQILSARSARIIGETVVVTFELLKERQLGYEPQIWKDLIHPANHSIHFVQQF